MAAIFSAVKQPLPIALLLSAITITLAGCAAIDEARRRQQAAEAARWAAMTPEEREGERWRQHQRDMLNRILKEQRRAECLRAGLFCP